MIDPEVKREGLKKLVTYGIIAVALAVTAPLAMYAVEGLIAWSVLGLGLAVVINFAPAAGLWFANKKVQALIAAIEANPIETMQNLFIEKQEELNRAERNITAFETEFRNVHTLVEDLKRSDPDEAVAYAEMRDKMKEGLEALRNEQRYATEELSNFKGQIDKARRIWKVSVAMNAALEKSQSAQAQVFADIKEKVAFDTVRTNLNKAFSNLNTAIERRKNSALFDDKHTKALPEASPKVEVIDLGKVKEKVSK